MTKEVWIVVGKVTDPNSVHFGEVEYQFSDGPPGQRGGSADYISLQKGLKDHSGCVIHWGGEMKMYTVTVEVREQRSVMGTAKVRATSREEAAKAARASLFDDFRETGWTCDDWEITDAYDACETE